MIEWSGTQLQPTSEEAAPSARPEVYRKSLSAAQNKAVSLAARMSVMEMEKSSSASKDRHAGLRARAGIVRHSYGVGFL